MIITLEKIYQIQDNVSLQKTHEQLRVKQKKINSVLKKQFNDEEIMGVRKLSISESEIAIESALQKYNKPEQFEKEYGMFAKIRNLISKFLTKRRKKIDVSDFIRYNKDKLLRFVVSRRYLIYNAKHFCQYICLGLFLRNKNHLRTSLKFREHYLFHRGEKKLESGKFVKLTSIELDVITLIKSIRQLRLFSQILLSEDQRLLLKYQRSNLIESGSSSSCDSDLDGEVL